MAGEEESRSLDYWARVEDHKQHCHCPKRRNPSTHCETHPGITAGEDRVCAQHAHTYDYGSVP
jgi:hypothetical protein